MQTDNNDCGLKTELRKSRGTFCVLVGVTGSVAALKLPLLVSQLLQLPGVSRPSYSESSTTQEHVITSLFLSCVFYITPPHTHTYTHTHI